MGVELASVLFLCNLTQLSPLRWPPGADNAVSPPTAAERLRVVRAVLAAEVQMNVPIAEPDGSAGVRLERKNWMGLV